MLDARLLDAELLLELGQPRPGSTFFRFFRPFNPTWRTGRDHQSWPLYGGFSTTATCCLLKPDREKRLTTKWRVD
jgi:hypothetical protein